ncbi:MAG TPA: Gldg family protein [Candidatus Binataceae bacterium]|nr:Gldg family protein [Candidatus Binataceae bacterium]
MDRPPLEQEATRGSLVKNFLLLIYTAAALAAVLVLANAIISRHNVRWDLTPNQRYSLSDFDKRVLGGLSHPVKVMAFVRTEDPAYLQLAELLFQAAAFTPMLQYEVIDVNKAPGLARQYGISSYGEVVVESQGRRRDFDNARSELLIPAILQISAAESKHIYLTVGHGEKDLFSPDRNSGFSQLRGLLEQNNYQIDNVSLFAGGVPDDAKVLISIGPEKDFLPEELAELGKYLGKGGHYLVMLDPYGSPSLARFLTQYHMDFGDRVVVDPAYRLTSGEILTTRIPLHSEDSPITRSMSADAVMSLVRGITITGQPGATAPDGLELVSTVELLRSSHESWASGDAKALTTGITEYQEGRDKKGPIAVGAEVDLAPASNPHIALGQMTRIVGFGSSAFASNQFIEMLGNRDLAVSAINALAGDDILIASRERLNRGETAGFFVTSDQSHMLRDLGAGLETMILFAIAALVFIRRRFFV